MGRKRIGITIFAGAALVLGTVGVGAQSGAAPTWKGCYRYEFDGGRTVGGSAIAITYNLAIVPGAARGGCLLSESGFQSDERIVCHASGDAKALEVSFHRYEDGKTTNKYSVAVYKPGQILFTLERGEGSPMLTRWDGFRPDLPAEAENPGAYLQAIKN